MFMSFYHTENIYTHLHSLFPCVMAVTKEIYRGNKKGEKDTLHVGYLNCPRKYQSEHSSDIPTVNALFTLTPEKWE